jgi:hypothetical protein
VRLASGLRIGSDGVKRSYSDRSHVRAERAERVERVEGHLGRANRWCRRRSPPGNGDLASARTNEREAKRRTGAAMSYLRHLRTANDGGRPGMRSRSPGSSVALADGIAAGRRTLDRDVAWRVSIG